MAMATMTQQSTLVARWVTVTDISGRERREIRWVEVPTGDTQKSWQAA